jgi:branched-chain amino acid transport system permease protein
MRNKILLFITRYKLILIVAGLVFALIFPFVFKSQYMIRMGTICLMYVMLTLSLNLLTGFMGQMSFGHAAFWGIGAYTTAILSTRAGFGSEVTFLLSMLSAGLFGVLLGLPVLKLKGYYLTLVTMAFCEIIRLVELNFMSLTRGPLGIPGIPLPSFFGIEISSITGLYFLMLALMIFTTFVVYSIINSRIGVAILAIRDDDMAAEVMGVNIFKYKVMTFTISAMLAGLAGAYYAQYISYIDPSSFTTNQSTEILTMVILGGLGSILGSFLGAISLSIIPEIMRGLMEYRMLIYGALMVILMLVKPEGILGNINFKYISHKINSDNGNIQNNISKL